MNASTITATFEGTQDYLYLRIDGDDEPSHFAGYKPTPIIMLTYVEVDEDGTGHANQSEYYSKQDLNTALLAFNERLRSEFPHRQSFYAQPLHNILPSATIDTPA